MLAFTKRNLLLYFRDKTAIFFSLLSVLILLALYVFFLRDLTSSGLPEFPSKKMLLTSWFIAGILAITAMTTTLGAFGVLVEDKSTKAIMDFYASPITRTKLIGGYTLSAFTVGSVMSLFVFTIANVYLFFAGETIIAVDKILIMIGVIFLSVLASGSMVILLVSFFKTSNAFASASMVIGTLLGFLAGIYIPIGTLPDYLQTIVKLFPVSHSVALFRQILMETFLNDAFAQAPTGLKETFQLDMGVYYEMKGKEISSLFSVFYLIATTILFFCLSLLNLTRKGN